MGKFCWLQVSVGGKPLREKVILELFDDVTPKTCNNFRALCTGNDGQMVKGTQTPMTFKGSTFHRIIPGFMIQGGDFTKHDGTGGVSIYGERFDDENFEIPCDKPGLLAMANAGPNTNGSQFFITADAAHHLTGKHVVFGRVVRGMNSVRELEHTETGANDKPVQACVVDDCGVFDTLPDPVPQIGDDTLPDYPVDCNPALTDTELLGAGEAVRQIGNNLFKAADYENAMDKYQKAVRFLKAVNKTTANAAAVDEKLVACHNNTAACALKLNQWSAARSAAMQVLNIDKSNAKALFRHGIASLSAGDAETAVTDLTQAQALDPENGEIKVKLQQAKEAEKARKAKLAAGLKKMFS